ncbi:MAG: hypothetical protein HY236_12280, partial [Acidobacteria bacterium]|nr:hypothetical protein [Acidobacteriota bacterium]
MTYETNIVRRLGKGLERQKAGEVATLADPGQERTFFETPSIFPERESHFWVITETGLERNCRENHMKRTWKVFILAAPSLALVGVATPQRSAQPQSLLNPKALAAGPAPVTALQLRENFQNSPAEFRSMPLWVWNDELEWPRLKEQLSQFRRQGMGGVFVHPRPGLMTEYLSEEWFRLWKLSVEEGKRLGLFVNIYDENSYPAGFAGGHVPSRAPDTASQYVQAELVSGPQRNLPGRGAAVGVFAAQKSEGGSIISARRIQDRADLRPGDSLLVFRLRRAGGSPWTAGFPYVDLTNPATAPVFLETTLEAYKKRLGTEFGKTIRWVFDDE